MMLLTVLLAAGLALAPPSGGTAEVALHVPFVVPAAPSASLDIGQEHREGRHEASPSDSTPAPPPGNLPAAPPSASRPPFRDVPGEHWSSGALEQLRDAGILTGDPSGDFRPEEALTREEWAAAITRALPLPLGDRSRFPDARGRWSEPYVAATERPEIYIGYPDGLMRPDQVITRAELAAVVVRTLRTAGLKQITPDMYLMPYPDGINHWARDDIAVATALGYFVGYPDGTFRPDRPATRAEAAMVLWRVWRDLGSLKGGNEGAGAASS